MAKATEKSNPIDSQANEFCLQLSIFQININMFGETFDIKQFALFWMQKKKSETGKKTFEVVCVLWRPTCIV